MKLYDNDAYREKFMEIVYGTLSSDETNDRANQIIDAYDNAPQVDVKELPVNAPLTLEQLREMDGEPVWVERPGYGKNWALVNVWAKSTNIIYLTCNNGMVLHPQPELDSGAKIYRRKPEEGMP